MNDSYFDSNAESTICPVCGEQKPVTLLVSGPLINPSVVEMIRRDHPEWSRSEVICLDDLHRYRMAHAHELVSADQDDLTGAEREVLASLSENSLISENVTKQFEGELTFGERVSDKLSSFGGSWTFIGLFTVFIAAWMITNVLILTRAFDPYPFILLNLCLSCLAAIQAPIILMSQNRQESRDRARGEHDYEVNLKAELEIRQLHEKLDHLSMRQWHRLMEIQEIQTELIDELANQSQNTTSDD